MLHLLRLKSDMFDKFWKGRIEFVHPYRSDFKWFWLCCIVTPLVLRYTHVLMYLFCLSKKRVLIKDRYVLISLLKQTFKRI